MTTFESRAAGNSGRDLVFRTGDGDRPNYALAYVGLADAYRTSSAVDIPGLARPAEGKNAAEKAVQIDDGLAVAHAQLGILAIWYDWDHARGGASFQACLDSIRITRMRTSITHTSARTRDGTRKP